MNPDSTLAVTKTCPKDGVHLWLIIVRLEPTLPNVSSEPIAPGLGFRLTHHVAWQFVCHLVEAVAHMVLSVMRAAGAREAAAALDEELKVPRMSTFGPLALWAVAAFAEAVELATLI